MTTYRIEEAELTLPAGWRDHTMNVFRLPGVKDANLIVTRDPETPIEDPQEYAEQQQGVVKEQFAGYKALRFGPLEIDGRPAFMVEFQWRGNGALLRQRQAFVRHRGLMMIVTLTALADNFAEHTPTWDEFLATMKLREEAPPATALTPDVAANDEAAAPVVVPKKESYVFALHARERVLHVLSPEQDPNGLCNAVDVEDGLWEFFDTTGQALRWRMLRPNRRGIFHSERGQFDLFERTTADAAPPLRQRLDEVAYLKARGALNDLARVRAHLEHAGNAAS